ncbi:hypothetical protein T492DRAFT_898303, partial [Pavlovales sp. CCMP2436]
MWGRAASPADALVDASTRGDLIVLRRLLAGGADADEFASDGRTALHATAAAGFADATLLLLEWGAGVHVLDGEGRAPLHLAIEGLHSAVVDVLSAFGADVRVGGVGWGGGAAGGGARGYIEDALQHVSPLEPREWSLRPLEEPDSWRVAAVWMTVVPSALGALAEAIGPASEQVRARLKQRLEARRVHEAGLCELELAASRLRQELLQHEPEPLVPGGQQGQLPNGYSRELQSGICNGGDAKGGYRGDAQGGFGGEYEQSDGQWSRAQVYGKGQDSAQVSRSEARAQRLDRQQQTQATLGGSGGYCGGQHGDNAALPSAREYWDGQYDRAIPAHSVSTQRSGLAFSSPSYLQGQGGDSGQSKGGQSAAVTEIPFAQPSFASPLTATRALTPAQEQTLAPIQAEQPTQGHTQTQPHGQLLARTQTQGQRETYTPAQLRAQAQAKLQSYRETRTATEQQTQAQAQGRTQGHAVSAAQPLPRPQPRQVLWPARVSVVQPAQQQMQPQHKPPPPPPQQQEHAHAQTEQPRVVAEACGRVIEGQPGGVCASASSAAAEAGGEKEGQSRGRLEGSGSIPTLLSLALLSQAARPQRTRAAPDKASPGRGDGGAEGARRSSGTAQSREVSSRVESTAAGRAKGFPARLGGGQGGSLGRGGSPGEGGAGEGAGEDAEIFRDLVLVYPREEDAPHPADAALDIAVRLAALSAYASADA